MKSASNVKPSVILALGDGSQHYNYNITKVKVPQEDGTTKTGYEYDTVHIWGQPTYEKVVRAVIREKYDESQEFALINQHNAFALGLSENENDKKEYEAYLSEVIAIKAMVKKDLANAGIDF